ncbi:MAG: C4-dicarboxylate ABC transporter substrate-binding protein [Hyphomicrobiales bacterium]|nr:MAG: C4-dicarboxylate ABC transporter substrate-binding protein [Hyphomicrobiales bacterium]
MRFMFLALAGLLSLTFSAPAHADDGVITLRVHHFLGPKSATHARMIVPWARRIEQRMGGKVRFEIYPSMTLGGKPPQLINQARDGIVDIVWTLAGYTAGRFVRTEVFELPTVHEGDPVATNLAIAELYDSQLAREYKGLHKLLIHVHQGQAFHMRTPPINKLEDLKGLKLRTPNRTGGWMIEALGAAPVGMPVPAVPLALSRGVVDGALLPFEVTLPLRIHEMVKSHMEFPGGVRFGTAVFLFMMNKARYEGLPADLRAAIDAESGEDFAREMGKLWLAEEDRGRKAAIEYGNPVTVLSPEETARFREAMTPVLTRWLKETGTQGLSLIKQARAAIARHSGQ